MNITRFKDFGNRVFESNTLYTEINLAEWKDCIMDNMEDFTSYEKNKLMMINNQPIPDIIFKLRPHLNRHIDKSKQYYFTVDIYKYRYNLFFRDERLPKSTEDFIGYTRFFQVLKMSDGWFLVDFYMRDYHILYKCDQFDGLMKLLKYYSFY
jgi:hypothetical protein